MVYRTYVRGQTVARFSIQIPDALDDWLEEQAQLNQRSKSAEITCILEQFWGKLAKQIEIFTGYNLPCKGNRHYFALDTPMEGDSCNCGKVKW